MKHLFKKRRSQEKKRELVKVRDDPTNQKETEEENTNYTFGSHDEESEESVAAGCCFFPRRSSWRPCCISDKNIRTEPNTDDNDDDDDDDNDDDDDDDDDDNDGVCNSSFSTLARRQISADKCGSTSKIKFFNQPWTDEEFFKLKKEGMKNRNRSSTPLNHKVFPSSACAPSTRDSKVLFQPLIHQESLLRAPDAYFCLEPEIFQSQEKYTFILETEDFQDEQKISEKYSPIQSDDTEFGSTNPMARTSSQCKPNGSPECDDEQTIEEDGCRVSSSWAKTKSGKADPPIMTEHVSTTKTIPPSSHLQFSSTDSCCLTRSHSVPSLSRIPKNNLTPAASLPDMKLKEFTPAISADDFDDETYRFQCSCPGLYQCSVTGLVFVMKGEGDVVYRTVPWNRRLLAQHHKKPAGPLFDIKCLQQSVCQLHLPHCEIISTGGGHFLQVAHVNDEGIEFISPHHITETHVVINITGFSGYGNVKDEDSPPDPVRALVLLFYRPPDDPDLTSFLSVLLLPKNVALRDVLRTRKKLFGDEMYIETSPHCKLHPKQVYTLSTDPEDDSVLVQPTEAEFDEESYDNYFPSFQVILETVMKNMKLFIRDSTSSHSVWQRQVYLSSSGEKNSCGSAPLNLPPNERLLNVRSSFIDGISGPALNSLLDKLLEKKVITDAEREAADVMQNRRDRARSVIDTVRKKGEAASSEMIEFLCEVDSFLCEHLGLI